MIQPTWVESLPQKWDVTPLKRVVEGHRPITYGIVQCGPDVEGGVPYIRPVDMKEEGGLAVSSLQRTAHEIAASYQRSKLMGGDLVVSIGPSFGKVMIVPPDLEGANLTQGTARVAPNELVDRRFLFWVLRSREVRDAWDAECSGATFRALTLEILKEGLIPLPPPSHQTDIAEFLDRETAKIDTLIEKKERLLELLDEKRTALVTRAVTRGLDPDVPVKESGVEWIGKIPEHWDVWKTPWLFAVGSGTTPKSDDPQYFGGGIPWVTTSELRENIITETSRTLSREALQDYGTLTLHPEGSVVVAMYGATIGRAAILGVSAAVNQACCVLQNPDATIARFAFYWLQAFRPEIVALASGGGQPNISQDVIRSLRIPVPPDVERARIVRQIDSELGRVAQISRRIERAIGLLRAYRSVLISAAVTGKIDVREKATV